MKVTEKIQELSIDDDLSYTTVADLVIRLQDIIEEAKQDGYQDLTTRTATTRDGYWDDDGHTVLVIEGSREETSDELKKRAVKEAKELAKAEKRKSKEAAKRRADLAKNKAKLAVQKAKLAKQVIDRIKRNNPDNKALHLALDGEGLDQFRTL